MFWFDALESRFSDPSLWKHLAWDPRASEPRPELEGCVVLLSVGAEHSLQLKIAPDLSSSLSLCWGSRVQQIAWDGADDRSPYVLRWSELDTICRALAAEHPDEAPFPGPVLLLLHRFAPICEGDDVAWITDLLVSAYRQCAPLSELEILDLIERTDVRAGGVRWVQGERGWILQVAGGAQHPLRSRRAGGDEAFPLEALEQLVARASERAGAPITPPPSGLRIRPQHPLELVLRHDDPQRCFPPVAAWVVAQILDGLLRIEGRGRASVIEGGEARAVLSLCLKGDREVGLQRVREVLWWIGAPGGAEPDEGAAPGGVEPGGVEPGGVEPDEGAAPGGAEPDEGAAPGGAEPDEDAAPGGAEPDEGAAPVEAEPDEYAAPVEAEPDEGAAPVEAEPDEGAAPGGVGPDEGAAPGGVEPDEGAGAAPGGAEPDEGAAPVEAEPDEDAGAAPGEAPRASLALEQAPEGGWSGGLVAVGFEVVHFGPEAGYRIDRIALGAAPTIRTWLEVVGADAVDPAGWQRLACADGGRLRIRVHPSGIAVFFERLSPDGAILLHRLLDEHGLVLAPMGIVADAGHGILGVPWPVMSVVETPAALYAILEAGPHRWWQRTAR